MILRKLEVRINNFQKFFLERLKNIYVTNNSNQKPLVTNQDLYACYYKFEL